MSKMLAAVLHEFNRLELEEVPTPRAKEYGEVVVRIKACGICATDYKAITGIRKNVIFPFIPGHEPSGIVAEVGPGVNHFKVGDEVIIQPSGYCGFCRYCRTGSPHYCKHAFTTGGDGSVSIWPGSFAEYTKTMEGCLYAKPKNISFDAAAITEPLSGAWKGVIQYSQMQLGDDVVIIGVGGIGLLCMMVAKAAGAATLIAVDTSEYALKNARRLGAMHIINPAEEDAKKRVYDVIPAGPDLIIEAAGSIKAVQLMVELRRRGTKWNLFGITTHEKFELDGGFTHFLEGRMDASFGTTPLAMSQAIRLMESGLIDTGKVISHRFFLSKIYEAMEVMGSSEHNKVMINP
ncbi:MAG: alcohol dehydrogenase catalytic domain-containing protein [Planctomycetota bacterium]